MAPHLLFYYQNQLASFGFGKRGLLEKGLSQKSPFSRAFRELEILENPQPVENKEESDHCLAILENFEILEILEIPPAKDPFHNDLFPVPTLLQCLEWPT